MSRRLAVLAGLISAGLVIGGVSPAIAATSAASAPPARLAPAAASPAPGWRSPIPDWGRAQPVPGTSAASGAVLQDVSCAPRGTCTAIGDYDTTSASGEIPFAITGKDGVWGPKQQLPGLAAFAPQGAHGQALDCPASGDCLVVGGYQFGTRTDPRTSGSGIFAQQEVNGTWGPPAAVPGSVLPIYDGYVNPTGVSCASPGNCLIEGLQVAAGGAQPGYPQSVFIAQESGYQWSAVEEVPGLAALNGEGLAEAAGVSCPAPGDCVVTGYYLPPPGGGAGVFTAVETDGTWQDATPVPTGAPANSGSVTGLSLSCPAAGKCVLAGSYDPPLGVTPQTGFVVTQTPGGWSAPVIFPGTTINVISCASAGNCAMAVQYSADVINEVHGTWGKVSPLPGVTDLTYNGTKAEGSQISNLVCPSAGNCTAAGTYTAGPTSSNDFVASEVAGKWLAARVPAGLVALHTAGGANVAGLDCAATANCMVGGNYGSTVGDGAFLLWEIPRRG
jgi:hypothetical protein